MPRLLPVLAVAVALIAPGLSGCGGKKRVQTAQAAPEAAVQAFRDAAPPRTLRGRFKLRLSGPDVDGATQAGMVLDRPNRLRLDIQTPLGTPLLLMATDGVALNAWVQRNATFYRGDDALAVLSEVTGGVVGVADLLDILTGRLPADEASVLDARAVEGGVQVILGKESVPDFRIRAVLDPAILLVRELDVAPAAGRAPTDLGPPVLTVRYPDAMKTEVGPLPEELVAALPTLGWTLELEFHTWDVLGVVPDVFTLEPVAGAQQADLVESLRGLAQERAGGAD
jgi:outer membrane biogenesis lipoprotein LolB